MVIVGVATGDRVLTSTNHDLPATNESARGGLALGPWMRSGCNTNSPCRATRCVRQAPCMRSTQPHGLDPAAHPGRRAVAGPGVGLPRVGGTLAPWGYARTRSVRALHGTRELRPRRVRCRGCRTTQVLLPAACLPRRADTVEIIGTALLAAATGTSHRRIAADLDRPADTVRGWIRRATAHAPHLREHATILAYQFDPLLPPIPPAPTLLGDAMEALGAAVAAATRQLGPTGPAWHFITWLTSGRLLAPPARTG